MPLVPYVASQKYKNLTYHRFLANEHFKLARSVAKELDMPVSIPGDYSSGDFAESALKIQLTSGSRGSAGSRFVDRDGELFQTLAGVRH